MNLAYRLEHIRVRHGELQALHVDSLELPAGTCTALLGDNGAGKSTLLELLAFIRRPDAGQIRLLGQVAHMPLRAELRRRIGFVGQQPLLLPGSVADNIELALKLQHVPARTHQRLLHSALETVGLRHLAGQQAATLSGGELKRAAIARAIAHEPDILLLDEPFSHLDVHHIRQLEQTLDMLAATPGRTVIFSSHDRLQAMALANNTLNLVRGRVTTAPLLNLFHGHCRNGHFDTGHIRIEVGDHDPARHHIAIDPREIVVSRQPLEASSLRNQLRGRLVQIAEEGGHVRLQIEAGERFHAIITPASLHNLGLRIGDELWLGFKANAVTVF